MPWVGAVADEAAVTTGSLQSWTLQSTRSGIVPSGH